MNLHFDNVYDVQMSSKKNKENGYNLDICVLA